MDNEEINNQSEDENIEDSTIVDEADNDDTVIPDRYAITSYGADFDVDGLVKRMERGDIFIPPFQRDYIWNMNEASRFIESLLLGLPVPGVFLAKEINSNKLYVIDGQQRLKTIYFFFKGTFNPKPTDKKLRVFKLSKVQQQFEGKAFIDLEESDRITLENSIVHATIIKQDYPDDNDTSVYHVFERLNNGGRRLLPQEIRTAVYHGNFIELLKELNENEKWRKIFGPKHKRLKDQELILRFLALYFDGSNYVKPMREFLNIFSIHNRALNNTKKMRYSNLFNSTIELINDVLGESAFRPERALNAAVYDSVMVGIARRLEKGEIVKKENVKNKYEDLLKDLSYQKSISQATSNETNVRDRINKSVEFFSTVE